MFVFHPRYVAALPAGHRFPMGKYTAVRDALADLVPAARFAAPEPAARAALLCAHGESYVDSVLAARLAPELARRIGFPVTAEVALRARLAVGGTLHAVQLALAGGFAANLAGGAHHAMPDGGAGYCVFNDLAVAAVAEVRAGRRVLVVDMDVHQGDGTAVCLAGVDAAFTFSIHAERNFPARKAASDLDIGLPDGCGDEAYLEALAGGLRAALARARPDLVLVQAGVDVHGADALGRLALTDAGLVERSRMVRAACAAAGVPVAATLGGGYGADLAALGRRHALALLALSPLENPLSPAASGA
jgi:acetoin utilization deacetylase AcuC-like enzyme